MLADYAQAPSSHGALPLLANIFPCIGVMAGADLLLPFRLDKGSLCVEPLKDVSDNAGWYIGTIFM